MDAKLIHKLKTISLWHLLWISLVASEGLTAIIVAIMSIILKGKVALDYLITGAVASLIVALVIVSIILYFIRQLRDAEEALRVREENYRSVFENTGTATVILENDMIISMANSEFEKLSGYSKEEIEGKMTWAEFIVKEDLERMKEYHAKRKEDEGKAPKEYEFRFVDKQGNIQDILTKVSMIPETKRSIASLLDITDRKRAEGAREKSLSQLRATLDSTTDGILVVDRSGKITAFNKRFVKMWSIPDALIQSRDDDQALAFVLDQLKDPDGFLKKVRDLYADPDARSFDTLEFKDGRTFERYSRPQILEGQNIGRVWSFRDVTDRYRMEAALQEGKERYQTVLDTNPDPVVVYDTEGHPQYLNPAFTEAFGWTIDELKGQRIPFVPDDQKEITAAKVKEIYALGKTARVETQRLTKQGDTIDVIVSAAGIKGPNGEIMGLVVNLTDITEKKKIETQLQRSQKMESMGLLAGGVAHDLNNVLSGIVSYPELLLLDLPEDSKLRKPIETIHESGLRAAAIVQDLLTVARGVATTKEPLNLNDLVGDYLKSPEFKKHQHYHPAVTVKTNLDSELFNVSGSHVHIRKVVMNLVSNASEAIEGSGNVTISTMNRYVDRPLRGYDNINIGEYAVLAVSDDGSGISSDDIERIFEPFYTKKVMGRSGTGLGLAVVWNVLQDHKGYINVTTDGNGTTFELYFPITRGGISDKNLSISIIDYKGNGETILVVDDVESQREISCNMLDTLGYTTKAVSSGEEAVEYLKENTVDLILLDMIMEPGINGRETYERIIKIHPNQKVIIVSGFAETDDVKEAQKLGAGKYIKKPLTLERIGLPVKEELGK